MNRMLTTGVGCVLLGLIVGCGLLAYLSQFEILSHIPPSPVAENAGEQDARAFRAPTENLPMNLDSLRKLFTELGEPQPGDWLDAHDEPGQTYREYRASSPVTARDDRRAIYIQPLGSFTEAQLAIVDATADFLRRYFQLPVKVMEPWSDSIVPAEARRRHPEWGVEQILTEYVLDELLVPRLPKDAAACLALTTTDLWPGEGWNFVFGQAAIGDRVGVWSIHRNGEPDEGEDAFRLCLLRTIKTASHETGHMFSMLHCTAYGCNMGGSNSMEESDRGPLACCPECLAKLWWATNGDLLTRYRELIEFCTRHNLSAERIFYQKCLDALSKTGR